MIDNRSVPIPLKANNTLVLVNGHALKADFRIVSEENWQENKKQLKNLLALIHDIGENIPLTNADNIVINNAKQFMHNTILEDDEIEQQQSFT